jgi:6-phosphogluconolactonase
LNKKRFATVIAAIAIFSAILAAPTVSASSFAGNSSGAVYVIDNSAAGNHILVYTRAPNGGIHMTGNFSAHGLGTGSGLGSQGALAIAGGGHFLVVVDAGSNEISVFTIHGTSLAYDGKSSSHGSTPISLTVYGSWVYVLNAGGNGSIAGFRLGESGRLSYIAGSTRQLSGMASPSPEQVGFSPDGKVLVVSEKATNLTDTYTVNQRGVASEPKTHLSNGAGPYGFAFVVKGKSNILIVSEAATNTMSSYAVSDQGGLRTISGAIPTFGQAPCWVVVSPNGRFAYTTNAHGGTISAFSISKGGKITLFSSEAAKVGIPALDMAFGGGFLYVRNGASITAFRVFPDGSLASVASLSGIPASATGLAAW